MKKILVVSFLMVLGSCLSNAMVHVIQFSYPSYTAPGLSVVVGDTILWKGDFSKFPLSSTSVPDGAGAFGATEGSELKYVVKVTGTYQYQCDAYKSSGMVGYFTAAESEKADSRSGSKEMVYINYMSHAFHLVASDVVAHSDYTVTISTVNGKQVYSGVLKAEEKDKWIATDQFLPGTYILSVTDGTHSFGRRFTL